MNRQLVTAISITIDFNHAGMAESVYAGDLKSPDFGREGSSPSARTHIQLQGDVMSDTPEENPTTEIRALWPYSSIPEVGMDVYSAGEVIGVVTAVYQDEDNWIVDMTLQGNWAVEVGKQHLN